MKGLLRFNLRLKLNKLFFIVWVLFVLYLNFYMKSTLFSHILVVNFTRIFCVTIRDFSVKIKNSHIIPVNMVINVAVTIK